MNSIEEQIEALNRASFGGPFPYQDCRHLTHQVKTPDDEFVPCLDLYFGDIEGLSSSPSRLWHLSRERLLEMERLVSRSFFERYPHLEPYRPYISSENTPELQRYMVVAEELRALLLRLFKQIIGAG